MEFDETEQTKFPKPEITFYINSISCNFLKKKLLDF